MDLLNWLSENMATVSNWLVTNMPVSPIVYLSQSEETAEVMGYVNFFIPIYAMIGLAEAWLAAIATYYIVSVVLRWLKVVE